MHNYVKERKFSNTWQQHVSQEYNHQKKLKSGPKVKRIREKPIQKPQDIFRKYIDKYGVHWYPSFSHIGHLYMNIFFTTADVIIYQPAIDQLDDTYYFHNNESYKIKVHHGHYLLELIPVNIYEVCAI